MVFRGQESDLYYVNKTLCLNCPNTSYCIVCIMCSDRDRVATAQYTLLIGGTLSVNASLIVTHYNV